AGVPRRRGDGKVWHSARGSIYDDGGSGLIAGIFPFPAFDLFREPDSLFSSVFGFCPAGDLNLNVDGSSGLVRSEYVTGDYFTALAVPPAAGRLLAAGDDDASATAVAVISFGVSQRRFGGAEGAVGKSVLINNVPYEVVGVTSPEFFGVNPGFVP